MKAVSIEGCNFVCCQILITNLGEKLMNNEDYENYFSGEGPFSTEDTVAHLKSYLESGVLSSGEKKEKIFTENIYEEGENGKDYLNGIRIQFSDGNKEKFFGYKSDVKSNLSADEANFYYVYIGVCGHGKIIEVGKSHFLQSSTSDGDWVKKVELKNSNSYLINHVMLEWIDAHASTNISNFKEALKKEFIGKNIVEKINQDYKEILFIPINGNQLSDAAACEKAGDLEKAIQKYFNKAEYNEIYLDKKGM